MMQTLPTSARELWQLLRPIADAAGRAILAEYAKNTGESQLKQDRSPLTRADKAAHDIIVERLRAATPHIPIVSEESTPPPYATRATWTRHWLVDPLDGTKEFLKRNGEFTVNIALIEAGEPVVGIVAAPALGVTYFGAKGQGATRARGAGPAEPIRTRKQPAGQPIKVIASRSHESPETAAFLATLGAHEVVPAGSSLKFCKLAEGTCDLYPRLAPTMEWDTAAGQAVLSAAGGLVEDLHRQPLRYGKEDLHNPHFIAAADPAWFQKKQAKA